MSRYELTVDGCTETVDSVEAFLTEYESWADAEYSPRAALEAMMPGETVARSEFNAADWSVTRVS
jgi:hypothetical protein